MTGQTQKKTGRQARTLFSEILEGFEAFEQERSAKLTLRTHPVEFAPPPEITPEELIQLRRELNLSRAVFAAYLRTRVRTLENWEQGRAKPNAQAVLLINLVRKYPDTVQRLAQL